MASRVSDLHAAFADPQVACILTVIGGFNSNELLPRLDWDLIAANPKIFCGYSDITAVQNAILARAGLVTYSGPHWSSFGMRDHFEQTQRWFAQALFDQGPIELRPAQAWTDTSRFTPAPAPLRSAGRYRAPANSPIFGLEAGSQGPAVSSS